MTEVLHIIENMQHLALDAASGSNSINSLNYLNTEYQQLKYQLNYIAEHAKFGKIDILNGTYTSLYVPLNNQHTRQPVNLMNTTTYGLNLSNTNLLTSIDATQAIDSLNAAINQSMNVLEDLKITNQSLTKAVKYEATLTMIDLRSREISYF